MNSPTLESSLKLIQAVDCLLKRPELQAEKLSDETNQAIEGVLETASQLQRECKFPDRTDIVQFLAQRFANEERELLIKRIVAIVGTLSNEAVYGSYEEICEEKPVEQRKKIRPPESQDSGKQGA